MKTCFADDQSAAAVAGTHSLARIIVKALWIAS
jgi:hypothetical protein